MKGYRAIKKYKKKGEDVLSKLGGANKKCLAMTYMNL